MEKITIGGANLCLENENLLAQDFHNIIKQIETLAKSKGFTPRHYQISGNPSPFGPSGQYPIFQVGKGRGSKRVEFLLHLSKKQYTKNKRYCSLGNRYSNQLQTPDGIINFESEEQLLNILNTLYNKLLAI